MSGWAIDPVAVDEIMTAVGELRPDLDAAVSDYRVETSLSYLQWGGVLTMDVQAAVVNLLADQQARLANIATRVDAGRIGVSLAAAAYDGGADDMCEEFQTEMVATAASGDFGFFQPYLEMP
jgi:hypothetical protein